MEKINIYKSGTKQKIQNVQINNWSRRITGAYEAVDELPTLTLRP